MAIRIKSPKQNYLSSITGPQLATVSGSTITYNEKYPLLVLSGGLIVESNQNQRYNVLSVDTDLIDLSAWSHHAAKTDINANGNKVINVSNPTNPNDAVNLQTLENTVNTELSGWAGYTASTNPNIGGNRVTNVADPTDPNDAVNLQTLQNEVSNWSSHAATSTPNMGGNRVTNVAEPVTNTDAATRGYVNSLFTGTVTEKYYQVVVLGGSAASGSSALEFQVSASSQPLGNPLDYKTGLSTTHVISASLTDQNKILWAVGSGGYVVSRSLAKFGEWEEVAAVSTNYPIDYKCIATDNSGTIVLAGKRTSGPGTDSIVQLFFPTTTTMNAPWNQIVSSAFTGFFNAAIYVPGNNTFQLFGQDGMYQVSGSGTGNSWSSRKSGMPVTQSLYAAVYDEYTNKYWVVGDGGVVLSSSNNTPISGSDFIEVASVSKVYPINYRAITTNDSGTIVLAGKRTAGAPEDSIVQLFFPTTTTMNAPLNQRADGFWSGSFHAVSYVPENDEFVLVGQDGVMQRSGSDTSNVWRSITNTVTTSDLYTIAQRDFSSYGGSNWAQYPAVKNVDINGFSIENVSDISTQEINVLDSSQPLNISFDGTPYYQFTSSSIQYQLATGSQYTGNACVMGDGFAVDGFVANGNTVVSRWTSAEADNSGNFVNGTYAIAGGPYSIFGDALPTAYGEFSRNESTSESRYTLKAKSQGLNTQRAEVEGKIDDTTGVSYILLDVSGSGGEQDLVLSDTNGFTVTSNNAEFVNRDTTERMPVFDGTYTGLPTGINSIVHGLHILSSSVASGSSGSVSWSLLPAISNIDAGNNKIVNLAEPVTGSDAATKAYVDTAVPELEWWDPVWTSSSSNISSVNNIECQYTRVYRAAGGSLVTLEGTLRVEITNDSAFTIFTTPLPVPATGTGSLRAGGICTAANRPDRSMVRITISGTESARNLSISAPPLLDATGVSATLTIGFRISYRAV